MDSILPGNIEVIDQIDDTSIKSEPSELASGSGITPQKRRRTAAKEFFESMDQLEEENDKLNAIVKLRDAEIIKLRQGGQRNDLARTIILRTVFNTHVRYWF